MKPDRIRTTAIAIVRIMESETAMGGIPMAETESEYFRTIKISIISRIIETTANPNSSLAENVKEGNGFMSCHLSLSGQVNNSLHGKPKRIASFEPDPESIVRVPHLWQRKLSFSLLLSKMKNYYSFIALKYGKVRIFINGSGMTW
ncbi:MAG: hypothetical protein ACYDDC_00025 [Thermoplasmataceae archaeon]